MKTPTTDEAFWTPPIEAVSVFFSGDFFPKKRKIIFKKAESKKKKSEIPPKSGRLTSLVYTLSSLFLLISLKKSQPYQTHKPNLWKKHSIRKQTRQ